MDEEKIIDNIKTFGSERYSTGYKDAIDDQQKTYEKGLEDAWECVGKMERLLFSGIFSDAFGNTDFYTVVTKMSASEAMQKIEEYEKKQVADRAEKLKYLSNFCYNRSCDGCPLDDNRFRCGIGSAWNEVDIKEPDNKNLDLAYQLVKEYIEIKVGDEVRNTITNGCGIVLGMCNGRMSILMREHDVPQMVSMRNYVRTGKHYSQIEEVRKQMEEEN